MKSSFLILIVGSAFVSLNLILWQAGKEKFPDAIGYEPSVVVRSDDPLLSWEGESAYFEQVPFSGRIKFVGKDGKIYVETAYFKGIKHGQERRWNSVGSELGRQWFDRGEIWGSE